MLYNLPNHSTIFALSKNNWVDHIFPLQLLRPTQSFPGDSDDISLIESTLIYSWNEIARTFQKGWNLSGGGGQNNSFPYFNSFLGYWHETNITDFPVRNRTAPLDIPRSKTVPRFQLFFKYAERVDFATSQRRRDNEEERDHVAE